MDCQNLDAKTADLSAGPAYRGRNIVQLKIEQNLFAGLYQVLRNGKASAVGEFQTNFIETHAVAQRAYQRLGFLDCRKIERDDKFFAGTGRLLLG